MLGLTILDLDPWSFSTRISVGFDCLHAELCAGYDGVKPCAFLSCDWNNSSYADFLGKLTCICAGIVDFNILLACLVDTKYSGLFCCLNFFVLCLMLSLSCFYTGIFHFFYWFNRLNTDIMHLLCCLRTLVLGLRFTLTCICTGIFGFNILLTCLVDTDFPCQFRCLDFLIPCLMLSLSCLNTNVLATNFLFFSLYFLLRGFLL
jgi:hypothetical protein